MIITIKNISINNITSEGKLLITIRNIIITKITSEGKLPITIRNIIIIILKTTSEGKFLITIKRNIITTKITSEGKFLDQHHLEARRCGFEGRRGRCRGGSDLIFSCFCLCWFSCESETIYTHGF